MIVKFFSRFFDDWKKPIYLWLFSIIFLIVSIALKKTIFSYIGFILLSLELLALLTYSIYQLSKKRWLNSLMTFVLFGGTIFAITLYSIIMFWIEQNMPDTWADNLTIPKNIEIYNPIDLDYYSKFEFQRPDSISNKIVKKIDFQLYNSLQPGLYEYDFWIGKIERGTIYLKAFEITQNKELSTNRLPKSSSIKIFNPTDSIKKFGTIGAFTIYEGDWGKPYAARFEIWFKPENGNRERKLFSKNYKIEGWMR